MPPFNRNTPWPTDRTLPAVEGGVTLAQLLDIAMLADDARAAYRATWGYDWVPVSATGAALEELLAAAPPCDRSAATVR